MLDLVLPTITTTKTAGYSSCYEIGPIRAGFSLALANALRRILLSSLDGAAITSLKIEGVKHEFQDLPAIKEDVTDIIHNLKKVRLRCFSDSPVKMYLDEQREGVVTAADLIHPQTIEVVNPHQYIAALDNTNAYLRMEMTVSTGRGFVEASAQMVGSPPLGAILIDAIYSPILHVNFTIESVIGKRDADTIVLEITTDGTISPDEALRESAHILIRQFAPLKNYWYVSDIPTQDPRQSAVPIPRSIYNMHIEELSLPHRSYNAFRRAGLTKVGYLLVMDDEEILSTRNVGVRALRELSESLQTKGLLPQIPKE